MSHAARTSPSVSQRLSQVPPLSVFRGTRDELRQPHYDAQVWSSVAEIDRAAWNQLKAPHDLFMDLRLLRAVEISMARDATFRYVLFRDADGNPAASACLCTYAVDGTVLVEEGFAKRMTLMLKRISPALVTYKIVFCGLPFSGGQSHLRFAEGVDHQSIITALDGMLKTIAREDKAKCIVFKEFQEHELPAVESVRELGYLRADSLPMNQLALEHTDFEAHLASLHHKKRYEIRKSIRKFTDAGLRMVTTSDPAEVDRLFTPAVHRMYDAVVARSDTKLEMLPPEFFREMVRQLEGNCEICFAMQDNQVRGFGLCLHSDTEYHPLFLGVDYDRNRDYDLYFNMMYASVADALRNRTKLLVLGQNANECKTVKLGSYQTPRYFYIKGVGVVMENAIRLLSKQLFPPRPVTVPFPG